MNAQSLNSRSALPLETTAIWRGIVVTLATLAVGGIYAGQQPADDFPIAEKQYRDGSRSLFHLHSSYGFVAMWENDKGAYFVYDKGRTNITMTTDLKDFVGKLSKIPDGSEVAWVNTCAAPLHYLMPRKKLSEIQDVLKRKRFKMAEIEDNNFILCTCETTNLVLFTNAPPTGIANKAVQRIKDTP